MDFKSGRIRETEYRRIIGTEFVGRVLGNPAHNPEQVMLNMPGYVNPQDGSDIIFEFTEKTELVSYFEFAIWSTKVGFEEFKIEAVSPERVKELFFNAEKQIIKWSGPTLTAAVLTLGYWLFTQHSGSNTNLIPAVTDPSIIAFNLVEEALEFFDRLLQRPQTIQSIISN